MNTMEYMGAVKAALGIESDYALSKALNVTRQTVSRYVQGKGYFDDAVAVKVAELLQIHPGLVMLDMHRERAKTPAEQTIWQEIFEGFHVLLLHAKSGRSLALPR
ncbi:helix-turn-helix protein [Janthinobacterium sp. HH106]|uniref:helix-turn-helix domain-containing protein n=1 Tax=Janthinobacterium sp. HH106 TaxID=1537278 RepID=UPI00087354C2|nr:helix-turn-helix domain-containing protein [Janthinobacterium sp. HH106]OEZ93493.1 helix-turn-helix protein [Janthinobacterium sp. HH106]